MTSCLTTATMQRRAGQCRRLHVVVAVCVCREGESLGLIGYFYLVMIQQCFLDVGEV